MLSFEFLENELWWGGNTSSFEKMPISANDEYHLDFYTNAPNQSAPLFLSNKGRIIFSKNVFTIDFKNGKITVEGKEQVDLIEAGENLKDAYNYASTKLYTFEKRDFPEIFFNTPQ